MRATGALALLALLTLGVGAEPLSDAQFIGDWCALIGTCVNQDNYCSSAPTIPAQYVTCDTLGNIVELVYRSPGQNTIPLSIGGLQDLAKLTIDVVSSPGFFSVPPEIGLLAPTLRDLEITGDGNGALHALPGQLGLLVNVERLSISNVDFPPGSAFPASMGQMSGLRAFSFFQSSYQNEFPSSMAQNWASIEDFRVSLIDNSFGPLPPLGNKPLLELYQLFGVEGTHTFDDTELFFSPNLRAFVVIVAPNVAGEISPLIYQADKLVSFVVFSSQLEFELDERAGQWAEIERIEFGLVPLSGKLPSSLAQLTKLAVLAFSQTQLSGTLPSQIGRLSALEELMINEKLGQPFDAVFECADAPASETLVGQVPVEIIDLLDTGSLRDLDLARSCFGGELAHLSRGPEAQLSVAELDQTDDDDGVYLIELDDALFSGALPRWLVEYARFFDDGDNKCDLSGNLFCFKPKPYTLDELECPFEINGAIDACGVCLGDNSACTDCNGVLYGPAREDLCGVCNGANECLDCAGTPNGASVVDACGVCRGDNTTCAADCAGVPHGTLELDECGVCGGDNACVDCAGVPHGSLVDDVCGVCGGTGSSCVDCAGTIGGTKVVDECGQCIDAEAPDYAPACYDCAGIANGTAVRDLCGSCPASTECKLESLALTHVLAGGYVWLLVAASVLAVLAGVLALASGLCGVMIGN